jgi:hypothetical protein
MFDPESKRCNRLYCAKKVKKIMKISSVRTPFVVCVCVLTSVLSTRIFHFIRPFLAFECRIAQTDEENEWSSLSDAFSNKLQSTRHAVHSTFSWSKKVEKTTLWGERQQIRTSDDRDERQFARVVRKQM